MACCAITSSLNDCRNWSCLDSDFCHAHRTISQEVFKDRWFKRYVLRWDRFTVYQRRNEQKMLSDLETKRVVLTKEDIRKIPAQDRFADIYLLLMDHGYVQRGTNVPLECTILWFYMRILSNFPEDDLSTLRKLIEKTMVLSSGQTLYDFLLWISSALMGRSRLTRKMIDYIPTLLDTEAAKQLSWFPRDTLDKLRLEYEKVLGAEHPITRCLVERWLLDLKELYQTEKAIQKIKMNQCKEELMMDRWHPQRLQKYLDMGYDIEQLDDIM
jgi:hypothetical protein